jgi:hypothetical protein
MMLAKLQTIVMQSNPTTHLNIPMQTHCTIYTAKAVPRCAPNDLSAQGWHSRTDSQLFTSRLWCWHYSRVSHKSLSHANKYM